MCGCTYFCVGVCTRARDCTCMQTDTFTALTPKKCELIVLYYLCVSIYIYLYIVYPEYICVIYILNQLGLITVKMVDKIVMVTIKILSLE